MTEEEAKTKLCCGPLGRNCEGSRCMAWRWTQAKETEAYLAKVQEHMKRTGSNFNNATGDVWKDHHGSFDKIEGHCGLAGKP